MIRITPARFSAALLATSLAVNAPNLMADTPTTITLVTYNIHVGVPMGQEIGMYKVGQPDLKAQADVLTSAAADIVALQEVDSEFGLTLPPARQRSSLLPMPRLLAHWTGLGTYVFGSAQDDIRYPSDNARYVEWGTAEQWTNNGAPHGEVGNALLTRLRLVGNPENLELPRAPDKERRACIRAELLAGEGTGRPVIVYAGHLQHDSNESRVEQMQAIVDRARREAPGTPVFIMGDMNHSAEKAVEEPDDRTGEGAGRPNPYSIALQNGFHDLHVSFAASRNGKPDPTYPADKPRGRIDYILCNQPLKVLEAEVIPSLASDHLALRLVVELPE